MPEKTIHRDQTSDRLNQQAQQAFLLKMETLKRLLRLSGAIGGAHGAEIRKAASTILDCQKIEDQNRQDTLAHLQFVMVNGHQRKLQRDTFFDVAAKLLAICMENDETAPKARPYGLTLRRFLQESEGGHYSIEQAREDIRARRAELAGKEG